MDEALGLYTGFGPHPEIEDLASLFVPRGVDPARLASLAMAGTWWGERSSMYASLAERLKPLAESDDASVAAVGVAGAEIYHPAAEAAEGEERSRRIRGEL